MRASTHTHASTKRTLIAKKTHSITFPPRLCRTTTSTRAHHTNLSGMMHSFCDKTHQRPKAVWAPTRRNQSPVTNNAICNITTIHTHKRARVHVHTSPQTQPCPRSPEPDCLNPCTYVKINGICCTVELLGQELKRPRQVLCTPCIQSSNARIRARGTDGKLKKTTATTSKKGGRCCTNQKTPRGWDV